MTENIRETNIEKIEAKAEVKTKETEVEKRMKESTEKKEEKTEPLKKEKIEPLKKFNLGINFKSKKTLLVIVSIVILAAIIGLAVWIRTTNIDYLKDVTTGKYTLGPDLDPFLYLRHAHEIVEGNLQDPDMMRMAPLGASNYAKTNLMPWAIVFIYKIFALGSIEFAAIIAPVIFFALTLIVFFFFVWKLFGFVLEKRKALITALIATAFYAVIPEMLHRTTAGIPEIESLGMLWFWAAFYFFISAWQTDKIKKQTIFGVLAGIFTGLMIWTWGGYRYIFMSFALASFLAFFFNKQKSKNLLIYFAWLIPALIAAFAKNPSLRAFTSITDTGLGLALGLLLLIDAALFRTKLKARFERWKLPESIITLVVTIVLGLIILLAINPGFIAKIASKVFEGLLYPFGRGRIGLTVAENRAPYFVEVFGSFSFLFWVFFFGTLFLFYEATKHFDSKKKTTLNIFFIIFMLTFIFSRISPQSVLNGENFFSKLLYFGGLFLFVIVLIVMYITAYKKKDEKVLNDFKEINFSYILLLAFMFWMIVSMRGAIRLFFIISPALIIAAAFLPIKIAENIFKTKDELYKILLWCAIIIVAVLLVITFINYTKASSSQAKYTVPGLYYQQWQKAMAWIRENTAKDAIFVHWWDYGYWIQTLGQRATVTDGGHPNSFWDHTTARYLMTAQNEKTALQLCKAHNVSYFLIDSSDIGKYPAYSSIGSDETGKDRLSWISTFILDEKRGIQEQKNGTLYVYIGSTLLDQDIIWEGKLFPQDKAGIGAFILSINKENEINSIDAIFVYNNQQTRIPIKYAYINNKLIEVAKDKEALNATLYFVPTLTQEGINNIGAALYLSEKLMRSEMVKLYLLNETEHFELVHSEPALFVQQLREQYNVTVGDFLITNQLLGPIKIFKVNYPEDIERHKEYLQAGWSEEKGPFASLDNLGV